MNPRTRDAIVDHLVRYDGLVEVGIGRRTSVAAELASTGVAVTATDVHVRAVPPGVAFVVDDVTRPTDRVYADADAIYSLNLPPDLHRSAYDLARRHRVDFHFTTLGGDPPTVPVRSITIPGDTLFVACDQPGR